MINKTYQRKIIVLATLLLVFGILLYFQNIQKMRQRSVGSTEDKRQQKYLSRVSLLEELPGWIREDISNITLEQRNIRLELKREPNNSWQLIFPESIPVRSGSVTELADSALGLYGKKISGDFDLTQPISQERYGFNQTKLTINYFKKTSDELIVRVLIGASIPGIGGYYATLVPGSGLKPVQELKTQEPNKVQTNLHNVNVATESKIKTGSSLFHIGKRQIDKLLIEANDLRKQQLANITLLSNQQQHLEVLQLYIPNNVLRVEFKTSQLAQENLILNEFQNFVMTKPYPSIEGVDQYQLERLLKEMPNPVIIKRYIEDNPKSLEVYGLGKTQRKGIYARDNQGNVLNLWLGKEASIDSVYAMEAPYNSVFTVGKEILTVLDFDAFRLVDKFVALVNIDQVDQIQLKFNDSADYRLSLLHNKEQTQNQNSGNTKLNGANLQEKKSGQKQNLDEDTTKDLYQKFLSLFLVGTVSDLFFPVDKTEVSLIYSLRDGRKQRINFFNYSKKNYYVVSRNGAKTTFLTEKLQLEQLRQLIGLILKTGQVDVVQ